MRSKVLKMSSEKFVSEFNMKKKLKNKLMRLVKKLFDKAFIKWKKPSLCILDCKWL